MPSELYPPRASEDSAPLTFSVVIPNLNYGAYLGAAVNSALNLDWPAVEVIVVDDGSTDDSAEILERFGDRISVIHQATSGPRAACNRGFSASRGQCVVFLDSDDQLEPSFAREVARVWRPGVSKVQVLMQRVDAQDVPLGSVFPALKSELTPEQIRYWMEVTGAYPTPPGSGNAYNRDFLERLMPLDDSCGDAADSACLAAAPFLGDVVSIPRPLVRYRVHARNRSKLDHAGRFTQQVERAVQRQRFAVRMSGRSLTEEHVVQSLRRGRHLLQLRIAERRLNAGPSPVPGDSVARLLRDSLTSIAAPGPERAAHRLAVLAWSVVTLLAPERLARRLVRRRFDPDRRIHRFATPV